MARAGQVRVDFNEAVFDQILNSAGVQALCAQKANAALAIAKARAPVDTGGYQAGLSVATVRHEHRTTHMVVGHDPKTLLIESQTGNLARALKAVR